MNARLRIAGGTVAMAALLLAAAPAGAGTKQSLHGTFNETAAGAATPLGYDIHGSAKMTIGEGSTTVSVNISGLDPTKHYGSHLHNDTCASGGGGHYQNTEGGATTHGNELHLSTSADPRGGINPNPGGVAHAGGTTAWEARLNAEGLTTNARSIVLHEDGISGRPGRIACADLS